MTDPNSRPPAKSAKSVKGQSAGKDLESMELNIALSSEELIRGLKHYKRIARQDLVRADEAPDRERIMVHAESRREIYSHLADMAGTEPARDVVREALRLYQDLPFVTGTPEDRFIDIKGRENALENFFLMINLEPKIRRQVRSQRSKLQETEA